MSIQKLNGLKFIGATVLGSTLALEHGLACSTGGGTHHAFPDHGAGFCLLNDVAIAARYVINKQLASRVLIVDLDVHQASGPVSGFTHILVYWSCSCSLCRLTGVNRVAITSHPQLAKLVSNSLHQQGDGTAFIFQDDGNVFTFSMHGEKNFPFRKEQSDLDVGLPDNTNVRRCCHCFVHYVVRWMQL